MCDVIELYPAVTNILSLHLIQSIFRVILSLKEASCLASHPAIFILADLDRPLEDIVVREEAVNILWRTSEWKTTKPHTHEVSTLVTAA